MTSRRDGLPGASPAMWLNEYHADYLAHDRMAEARARAARRHIVEAARRQPRIRVWIGRALIRLGRRMAAPSAAR